MSLERRLPYYEKFADYVQACNERLQRRARTFVFDLWLANTGTSPGSDIDLELRFPTKIVTLAEADSDEATELREPLPPIPPKLPSPFPSPLAFSDHISSMRVPDLGRIGLGEREVQVYVYNNGNQGYGIHATCTRLKHHKLRKIGTFIAEFQSWEKVIPFESGYSITASESPKPIEGKVVFKVRMEKSVRE